MRVIMTSDEVGPWTVDSILPLEPEERPILEAIGQVLADDLVSEMDIPPFRSSAMDGYAVRWEDTAGASPFRPRLLKVSGRILCGDSPAGVMPPGTALQITTGAIMPAGANAVVRQEDTDHDARKPNGKPPEEIGIFREARPGAHVRPAGEDIARGSLVLPRGRLLRVPEIGVLASLGRDKVRVVRRPVVSILTTGNELVPLGRALTPGKIYDSNGYALAAQVLRCGGVPNIIGTALDDVKSLSESIRKGLECDLLITSAGVSTGAGDLIRKVLTDLGADCVPDFRTRPGRHVAFGWIEAGGRKIPVLALPGYSVSSMLTFENFARPIILKLMGKEEKPRPLVKAIAENTVKSRAGMRSLARVKLRRDNGHYSARLTVPPGAGILTSIAEADGLLVIPENRSEVSAGDEVSVQLLDWGD
jgi:molybdopterin molybdotransferase